MISAALGNGKHVWLTWATSERCNLIPQHGKEAFQ